MSRFYRLLLRLYPREFRETFAAERSAVFEQAPGARRQGGWASVRFFVRELGGLVAGAAAAWAVRRGPALDLRKLRPPDVSHGALAEGPPRGGDAIRARSLVLLEAFLSLARRKAGRM